MKISWINPEQLIEFELIQLRDENVNTADLEDEWESIKKKNDVNLVRSFLDELEKFKNVESNEKIESFLNNLEKDYKPLKINISDDDLYNKILGGWTGRAAGCLLGKPVEKYSSEIIKEILKSNNSYPLKNYITAKGIPENILLKYPWNKHSGIESLSENIVCMPEDDDLNYTMLNLDLLERKRKNFSTEDVAEFWLSNLPVLSTFTAERIAYINLLNGMDIRDVPVIHNPYREWIGAMIRADIWGWISPGNPLQAVKLAYKDARLSHSSNGIFGSMFIAAALSLSLIYESPKDVLNEAIKFIPENSLISEAVNFSFYCGEKYSDWEMVLDELQKKYGNYFWVHSVNNCSLIASALIFGKGDYEKSVCCAVMAGWDTDSCGATVGSIVGTILGYKAIPFKWINPLNNNIRSSLKGFDNSRFDDLAKRTLKLI
jgi:ADP-ribosylglycohydrolase